MVAKKRLEIPRLGLTTVAVIQKPRGVNFQDFEVLQERLDGGIHCEPSAWTVLDLQPSWLLRQRCLSLINGVWFGKWHPEMVDFRTSHPCTLNVCILS